MFQIWVLDGIRRDSPIDQDDTSRFVFDRLFPPPRGTAGLPKNCRPDPPFFQTGGEPFHLRRFSAALGTFQSRQRHGHDFAAKGSHCRIAHFRLVRLASEEEV